MMRLFGSNSYPSVILMYDDATLSKPILKTHVHTMADCLMANFEDCQTKSLLDEVKLHTNLELSWLDNYSGEFQTWVYNAMEGKEANLDNLNSLQLQNLQQTLTKYKNTQPILQDTSTPHFEATNPIDSESDSNSNFDSSSKDYLGV